MICRTSVQPVMLLNKSLKQQKLSCCISRRMIVRIVNEKGIDELKKRILQNLDDLLIMIQWNEDNEIKVADLSSELCRQNESKL